MFTGIIEELAQITKIETQGTNKIIQISSALTPQLKIDQSIAHNGICLTVTDIEGNSFSCTAVAETREKTNIDDWKVGDTVNLERCMQLNARLDGHIVQGHVDTIGIVREVKEKDGSWDFFFAFDPIHASLLVQKGSICINGVSLTVVELGMDFFSVTIIPYTYAHTNFSNLKAGDRVNLEFDIIGKYILRSKAVDYNLENQL